ncbi:hypothetical protein YC2023_078451 [Brassica napus]
MFRPEILQPMGLPEDVQVIAWGLSLERPTMIFSGIKNIRDLFGHKNVRMLWFLRSRPSSYILEEEAYEKAEEEEAKDETTI